jgi:hypothetical protein
VVPAECEIDQATGAVLLEPHHVVSYLRVLEILAPLRFQASCTRSVILGW